MLFENNECNLDNSNFESDAGIYIYTSDCKWNTTDNVVSITYTVISKDVFSGQEVSITDNMVGKFLKDRIDMDDGVSYIKQ